MRGEKISYSAQLSGRSEYRRLCSQARGYAGRNQRETPAERTGRDVDSERYSIPGLENPQRQIETLKPGLLQPENSACQIFLKDPSESKSARPAISTIFVEIRRFTAKQRKNDGDTREQSIH